MKSFFSRLHDSQTAHSKSAPKDSYKFWTPNADSERRPAPNNPEGYSNARTNAEARTTTRTPKPTNPNPNPAYDKPAPSIPPIPGPSTEKVIYTATRTNTVPQLSNYPASSSQPPLPPKATSSRRRDYDDVKPQPPPRSFTTPAYLAPPFITPRDVQNKPSRYGRSRNESATIVRHEVWVPSHAPSTLKLAEERNDGNRDQVTSDEPERYRSHNEERARRDHTRRERRDRDRPQDERDMTKYARGRDREENGRMVERESARDRDVQRQRDKDKERARETERERYREAERDREKERDRERDKAKEREREREKEKEREMDREREREEEREREAEMERERERQREKEREREAEKEKERERQKERDAEREKERQRERERRDKEYREKARERREREKEYEREKLRREREREKIQERETGSKENVANLQGKDLVQQMDAAGSVPEGPRTHALATAGEHRREKLSRDRYRPHEREREQRYRAEVTDGEELIRHRTTADRDKRRESKSGWVSDNYASQERKASRQTHQDPAPPAPPDEAGDTSDGSLNRAQGVPKLRRRDRIDEGNPLVGVKASYPRQEPPPETILPPNPISHQPNGLPPYATPRPMPLHLPPIEIRPIDRPMPQQLPTSAIEPEGVPRREINRMKLNAREDEPSSIVQQQPEALRPIEAPRRPPSRASLLPSSNVNQFVGSQPQRANYNVAQIPQTSQRTTQPSSALPVSEAGNGVTEGMHIQMPSDELKAAVASGGRPDVPRNLQSNPSREIGHTRFRSGDNKESKSSGETALDSSHEPQSSTGRHIGHARVRSDGPKDSRALADPAAEVFEASSKTGHIRMRSDERSRTNYPHPGTQNPSVDASSRGIEHRVVLDSRQLVSPSQPVNPASRPFPSMQSQNNSSFPAVSSGVHSTPAITLHAERTNVSTSSAQKDVAMPTVLPPDVEDSRRVVYLPMAPPPQDAKATQKPSEAPFLPSVESRLSTSHAQQTGQASGARLGTDRAGLTFHDRNERDQRQYKEPEHPSANQYSEKKLPATEDLPSTIGQSIPRPPTAMKSPTSHLPTSSFLPLDMTGPQQSQSQSTPAVDLRIANGPIYQGQPNNLEDIRPIPIAVPSALNAFSQTAPDSQIGTREPTREQNGSFINRPPTSSASYNPRPHPASLSSGIARVDLRSEPVQLPDNPVIPTSKVSDSPTRVKERLIQEQIGSSIARPPTSSGARKEENAARPPYTSFSGMMAQQPPADRLRERSKPSDNQAYPRERPVPSQEQTGLSLVRPPTGTGFRTEHGNHHQFLPPNTVLTEMGGRGPPTQEQVGSSILRPTTASGIRKDSMSSQLPQATPDQQSWIRGSSSQDRDAASIARPSTSTDQIHRKESMNHFQPAFQTSSVSIPVVHNHPTDFASGSMQATTDRYAIERDESRGVSFVPQTVVNYQVLHSAKGQRPSDMTASGESGGQPAIGPHAISGSKESPNHAPMASMANLGQSFEMTVPSRPKPDYRGFDQKAGHSTGPIPQEIVVTKQESPRSRQRVANTPLVSSTPLPSVFDYSKSSAKEESPRFRSHGQTYVPPPNVAHGPTEFRQTEPPKENAQLATYVPPSNGPAPANLVVESIPHVKMQRPTTAMGYKKDPELAVSVKVVEYPQSSAKIPLPSIAPLEISLLPSTHVKSDNPRRYPESSQAQIRSPPPVSKVLADSDKERFLETHPRTDPVGYGAAPIPAPAPRRELIDDREVDPPSLGFFTKNFSSVLTSQPDRRPLKPSLDIGKSGGVHLGPSGGVNSVKTINHDQTLVANEPHLKQSIAPDQDQTTPKQEHFPLQKESGVEVLRSAKPPIQQLPPLPHNVEPYAPKIHHPGLAELLASPPASKTFVANIPLPPATQIDSRRVDPLLDATSHPVNSAKKPEYSSRPKHSPPHKLQHELDSNWQNFQKDGPQTSASSAARPGLHGKDTQLTDHGTDNQPPASRAAMPVHQPLAAQATTSSTAPGPSVHFSEQPAQSAYNGKVNSSNVLSFRQREGNRVDTQDAPFPSKPASLAADPRGAPIVQSRDIPVSKSSAIVPQHAPIRHKYSSSLPTPLAPAANPAYQDLRSAIPAANQMQPPPLQPKLASGPPAPEKQPVYLPRASSEETILMTPSSLAQSVMLKPTASRQSVTPSVNSQTGKKGIFSRFRRSTTPAPAPAPAPAPQPYELWRPNPTSRTPDSSPKRSEPVETSPDLKSKAPSTRPNNVQHPLTIAIPSNHPESKVARARVFTPFEYLKSKKNRSMSVASVEARDGTAPSTVIGSPTTSMHSSAPIHIPPPRDTYAATQEWLFKEEHQAQTRPKGRRPRPGVVIDAGEDAPESKKKPRRNPTRYRSSGKQKETADS